MSGLHKLVLQHMLQFKTKGGHMRLKTGVFIVILTFLMALYSSGASALAAGYGQGKECDALKRPIGAINFQQQYADSGVYAMSDDSRRIILTFDQGYENGYTTEILDALREKHVTAMFFLTGDYAKKESELVERMIREGHMIGNHGMKHLAAPLLSEDSFREEVMSLHEYVKTHYNYEMQYFRPPCGEYDEKVLDTVRSLGYRTVFWSFAYIDWKTNAQPNPKEALDKLVNAAHPGAIYLLHSVSETNAVILGNLIDALRQKGFTL